MDEWETDDWESFAYIVGGFILLKVSQPIWTRFVGWHFPIRHLAELSCFVFFVELLSKTKDHPRPPSQHVSQIV
jgi:hypothetical protein